MVKSHANLWPSLTAWENLVLAYRKCRKRKRYKAPATAFDINWEVNLLQLQQELIDGRYAPGPYRHFWIVDPKLRKISAAPFRDRIVHHALVNVLEPIFERRFVFDSYACRRGKGTHRAISRAQKYLRRYDWYLKTDIVRFFPNVDHALLFERLTDNLRDARFRGLIACILKSGEGVLTDEASQHWFPGDDLLSVTRPKGLPIGNLTSQFFANVFLDPVDHFIKEELRVPGYVRYADDLLLFGHSKATLWQWKDAVADALAKQRLQLHSNKTHLRPSRCGVPFLGFRVYQDGQRLKQETIRRFNRRIRGFRRQQRNGAIRFSTISASLKAWLAHARQANSTGIRRQFWKRLVFRPEQRKPNRKGRRGPGSA